MPREGKPRALSVKVKAVWKVGQCSRFVVFMFATLLLISKAFSSFVSMINQECFSHVLV